MNLFVIGLNHKTCSVEVREKIHFSENLARTLLCEVKDGRYQGIEELVVLSTCNRVELYGVSHADYVARDKVIEILESYHEINRSQFEDSLYYHEGTEAIEHIFRVGAGLNSLVIGENEILGQLRDGFKLATSCGSVHSLLYRLLEKVLKTGKDVRAESKITRGAVSIPSVAVELAQKIFGSLENQKVMVIGTGEMATLTLKNLTQSGAPIHSIVSRNREKGEDLATQFHCKWVGLEDWHKELAEIDILVTSTSAPQPIITFDQIQSVMMKRKSSPLFLIDIAVPRDVEAEVDKLEDVYLYNVDDLQGVANANLRLRKQEVTFVEKRVVEAVDNFKAWMEQLSSRPTMERFESFLEEIIKKEVESLSKETKLSSELTEKFRHRLRAKILHHPFEKIKEASKNGGVTKHLEALNSLFDLDDKK